MDGWLSQHQLGFLVAFIVNNSEKYRSDPGPLRYCKAQGSLPPYHVPPRPVNSKGPGYRVSASPGSPRPGSLSSDPVPMLLRTL